MQKEDGKSLSIPEALAYCKAKGYTISRQGLYTAAAINGFLNRAKFNNMRFKWSVDFESLKKYVRKALEPVPEGFITVKEASKYKSVPRIYQWIKEKKLQPRRFGAGIGVMYVEERVVQGLARRDREDDNGT